MADLVFWRPDSFGAEPEPALKASLTVWAPTDGASASRIACEPVRYRPTSGHVGAELARVRLRLEAELHPDWVAYRNAWREDAPDGVAMTEMSWVLSCDVWLERVLHGRNASPRSFNAGTFHDASVDAIPDEARRGVNPSARMAAYRRAAKRIAAAAPVLPLLSSRRGMVAIAPHVPGVRVVDRCWLDLGGAHFG